ncbi:MAG: EAL domain-containing protein [Burkholderiaceae bacterium]|nr:EAL domain-containing protein [Burkholderiaceae bacterium]MEB2320345.1 EAL domain-containing protein [Pseudomonadota bacterium]
MKRRPAHPLLALQLRRAGIEVEGDGRVEAAAMRRLLDQVGRTYAETDQAMLTVQMAERRSSRELAELYRKLQLERGELEEAVRERAAELALSQAELAETQRLASMGNWQYLPQLRRLEISRELAALLELDAPAADTGPAALLGAIFEDDRPRVRRLLWRAIRRPMSVGDELRVITVGGEVRWFMCRIESELGPDYRIGRLRGTFIDVSERHRAQAHIEHLAYHDELTGLPNRACFRERVDRAVERARGSGDRFAVLFIDLDGFKVINDSLGHDVGDKVLIEIAARLSEVHRDEDMLSRFGGDEFLVLVDRVGGRADAAAVAHKMLEAIERPLQIGSMSAQLSGSVGVAMFPDDGADTGELLRNADAAMYARKANGRHGVHFYTPEINARSLERLEMVNELRHAIERAQFVLAFQPIIGASSGRIDGIEALVRWAHPKRGIVEPGRFIPIAEEAGLIGPIGRLVMQKACRQLVRWRRAGADPIYMSVNVSPAQFESEDFVNDLRELLAATGLAPELLQLEITESMVMGDPDRTASLLRKVKALGVRLSLDDFGTGHSSLAYLRRFPIDVIKIDRSFVNDIVDSRDDAPIVRAIIAIAASMGSEVIAEGVETEMQRDVLIGLGCHQMQGFLFHRPMPATMLGPTIAAAQATTGRAAAGLHG